MKRSAASISSSGRFQFHDDWIELLSLLIKNRVKFLVVGGHALALDGKPFRIDILNTISGVSFATAWRNRIRVKGAMGILHVLSRRDFVANKRASARPKDVADLALLGVTAKQ